MDEVHAQGEPFSKLISGSPLEHCARGSHCATRPGQPRQKIDTWAVCLTSVLVYLACLGCRQNLQESGLNRNEQ